MRSFRCKSLEPQSNQMKRYFSFVWETFSSHLHLFKKTHFSNYVHTYIGTYKCLNLIAKLQMINLDRFVIMYYFHGHNCFWLASFSSMRVLILFPVKQIIKWQKILQRLPMSYFMAMISTVISKFFYIVHYTILHYNWVMKKYV